MHVNLIIFPPSTPILYWVQVYAPGIEGVYVTVITFELPGRMEPDFSFREKDKSFSSSLIFSIV